MKIKNKKMVAMVAAVAIFASLCVGAYSYFTDYATTYAKGTAGTLEIKVTDVTPEWGSGELLMIPGIPQDFSFTVENVAEKSVDVKSVISFTFDREITASAPEIIISDMNGNPLDVELSNGNKTMTLTAADVVLNGSKETESGVSSLSTVYSYKITFSEDADVSWQGFSMNGKLEVYAKQHRNTEDMASDWIKIVEQ